MKLNVTAPGFYMFCYGRLVSLIQTDMLMVFPHPRPNGLTSSSNANTTTLVGYLYTNLHGITLKRTITWTVYAFIIITDDLDAHTSDFLSKAYNAQSIYFIFGAIKMSCLWLHFPNSYKWNVGTSNVQTTVSWSECLPSTFWSNTIFCSIISNAIFTGDIQRHLWPCETQRKVSLANMKGSQKEIWGSHSSVASDIGLLGMWQCVTGGVVPNILKHFFFWLLQPEEEHTLILQN